jgi:hypothetical protein
MSIFLHNLNRWLSIDSEPFILTAIMCLIGAYVMTQILKNTAMGILFYPVLLFSSVASIGIGMQLGLIGYWYNSMPLVLAAICFGMSLSAIVLLGAIAIYNRNTS